MSLPGMCRNRTVTFHPSPDPTFHSFSAKCVWVYVCVRVDKKYVSFLHLWVCLPVCERFHFYTAALVTDVWPCSEFSMFWGLQTEWLRKHSLFVTALTTVLSMAKLHHITNSSGEGDPNNCIFGSLGPHWSKLIEFPSFSTSLWQPAPWQSHFVLSW